MNTMMKCERINYYQSIHKTLRRLLFLFSIELGTADFTSDNEVLSLIVQFEKVKKYLDEHADHEDTFFHPFIHKQIPNECEQLEIEHRALEIQLEEVAKAINGILKEVSALQRQNLGYSLYLSYNKFIASYLDHLHEEETKIMPKLWDKNEDNILLTPLKFFIENMTQEDFISSKNDFILAISPQEKASLYGE